MMVSLCSRRRRLVPNYYLISTNRTNALLSNLLLELIIALNAYLICHTPHNFEQLDLFGFAVVENVNLATDRRSSSTGAGEERDSTIYTYVVHLNTNYY